MTKRVFLIVLDSFGIGEMPDADKFGDVGSNTFKSVYESGRLYVPNMKALGLFNIDGVTFGKKEENPVGAYARLEEKSFGKDTTTGHWEIAGLVTQKPFPVFPEGFPYDVIDEFTKRTGKGVLCNRPYSGTQVIKDYGEEHISTGKLIVYTSADSVFQIAAHEDVVPREELYGYCKIAREILTGEYGVGRVIARPFIGKYPDYERTSGRHDFSIEPTGETMLDRLKAHGFEVKGIGKINDIFAGRGITDTVSIISNADGMEKLSLAMEKDFTGLCFVNLVDFDMHFGHRNDVNGYVEALNDFDKRLSNVLKNLKDGDLLMITADHGCDPSTVSTDHSREFVPLLVYGNDVKKGVNIGTVKGFDCIASTVLEAFGIEPLSDNSLFGKIIATDKINSGERESRDCKNDNNHLDNQNSKKCSDNKNGEKHHDCSCKHNALESFSDESNTCCNSHGHLVTQGKGHLVPSEMQSIRIFDAIEEKNSLDTLDGYDFLIDAARNARRFSYCPYSGYSVGAAILTKGGEIYTGCNVESKSFSPTNCAERTAIFKAVSEGRREFVAIAVVGGKQGEEGNCTPCGVCRQALAEFVDGDFRIVCKVNGEFCLLKMKELLPYGFEI